MDVYHAAMKEWYWFVILGALVAVAFCPTFLKEKCPRCKKRSLKTVDVDTEIRRQLEQQEQRAFLTFYRCTACSAKLVRERTAPHEDATEPRWAGAFDKARVTELSTLAH